MIAAIETLNKNFSRLSMRLRWLVVCVLAAFIFFIWWDIFRAPLHAKVSKLHTEIGVAKKRVHHLQGEYDLYEQYLHVPKSDVQNKIQLLQKQVSVMEQNPLIRKNVVQSRAELQQLLLAISQATPGVVINQLQVVAPANKLQDQTRAGKNIALEFHGDYFTTMRYFSYLESLPWFISFDSVDYEVVQYPNAKVLVVIHVLNEDKGLPA